MANLHWVGQLVRCSVTFTDENGASADPTAVFFQVKDPSGDETAYTYGEDEELVRDDTGDYHVDVSATEAGEWWYSFYATGTGQAADEGWFRVAESKAGR